MIAQPDAETLLAVVLGATLATVGGFSERHFERVTQRREKERSAALLFGELLSAMRVMMKLAKESHGRGDPFGPITLRFMRAVQREVEIYNRNRETLLDLRAANVRAGISVLIARLSFAIDGVIDTSSAIAVLESEGKTETLAELKDGRTTAFEFAVETGAEIMPLLAQLAPLAQHNFGATESAVPTDIFANPAPEEAQ